MKILSRLFLLSFCILVPPILSISQKLNIIGSVADSATGKPISDIAITLFKNNKAVIHTISDTQGTFQIKDLSPDAYRLFITHMAYHPYQTSIHISQSHINLGKIFLRNRSIDLHTIEIKQSIPPVTIKKDTLEFNSAAYKTNPNAIVSELLRQIPGIAIDQTGKISAHGETIKRVLVDGKPFYGNNAALTTQTLPAEIVDKIQVIDGKSEQSQFSGFDDGKHEKIINITLKKNRRHGVNATTTAGAGTNDHYSLAANVNSFNEKDRLSAIANGNNLNNRYYNPGNTFSGSMPGNGMTRNWSGALNYNYDSKKKLSLDASYEAVNSKTENSTSTFRQTFLPDTAWYYSQQNHTISTATNHNMNLRLNYKISPTSSLLISPMISYNVADNTQTNNYESLNKSKEASISGSNLNTNHETSPNINLFGILRKRLQKPGQTLSADFSIGKTNTQSEKHFLTKDSYLFLDITSGYDRLINTNFINSTATFSLSYTHPLPQNRFMEVSYHLNTQTINNTNNTYDIDTSSGKYEHPNDSLSNVSKNNLLNHSAGLSIRTVRQRYDYAFGINTQFFGISNKNTNTPSFSQHYLNLYPTARLNITLSKGKTMRINYEGSNTTPSVQQLQPLPDLSNSLLIQQGNPDLKPSFTHKVTMGYNGINPTTFRSIFLTLSGELVRNKIVNVTLYDTTGHQITRPVNANGAVSFTGFVANSLPLKAVHATLNLSTGFNYNRDITFINLDNNNYKAYTHNLDLTEVANFNYRYKQLDITTIIMATWTGTRYGNLSDNKTNFFSYNLFLNYNYNLPKGFMIGNDLRYIMNRGRSAGFNNTIMILNGYIAKNLFKQKQALVKLYSYDLLHQNESIVRNIASNYIEDVRQKVLNPYFMISFTWFFKKYPQGQNQEG